MTPKLRKQADDSQVGQTSPEVCSGQDPNMGIGQTCRMNTKNNKTMHVDDSKNPEMIATFQELAQTQKLIFQKSEEQSKLRNERPHLKKIKKRLVQVSLSRGLKKSL